MNKIHSLPMKPKLLLLLMVLIGGCNLPFGSWSNQPGNVEVIVPEAESKEDSSGVLWMLSPGGDKISYYSFNSQKWFMLTPATGEKKEIEGAKYCLNWLDNTSFLCDESVIFINDHISKIPLLHIRQRNDISGFNLIEELRNARKVYFLEREHNILMLSTHLDKSYHIYCIDGVDAVFNCNDLDTVLKGYNTYVTIPMFPEVGYSEKMYSPNGAYYYKVNIRNGYILTIYDVVNDTKLAEVKGQNIEPGGWAADNSGVYFQIYYHPFGNPYIISHREAIKKLKVYQ